MAGKAGRASPAFKRFVQKRARQLALENGCSGRAAARMAVQEARERGLKAR